MNDAELTRIALKVSKTKEAQFIDEPVTPVFDSLAKLWDEAATVISDLRDAGLDLEAEGEFWPEFERLLENLKYNIRGESV